MYMHVLPFSWLAHEQLAGRSNMHGWLTTHTHKHTRLITHTLGLTIHTHTHTHTHTHSLTHSLTHTHTLTPSHTHTRRMMQQRVASELLNDMNGIRPSGNTQTHTHT